MGEPLVSVFVPAYNSVKYIDEAIGSAVDQDYPNLVVVVGDDGSTDGTAERIREWGDRYPERVLVVGGAHLGITGNCNRVMSACQGKYVAMHAGDDVFLPGKISRQVAWMEADSARVMCGHTVEAFDTHTGERLWLSDVTQPLKSGRGAKYLVDHFGLFTGPSIMLRREVIPPFGFDERVPTVSDFKFQVDCLASGGAYGFIEGLYSRYRVHPDSVSQRSLRSDDVHKAYFQGFAITLALIEANYSWLSASCRRARATLLFSEARWRHRRGEQRAAADYYRSAMLQHYSVFAKALAGVALTVMPKKVQEIFEQALNRRRGAVSDEQRIGQ